MSPNIGHPQSLGLGRTNTVSRTDLSRVSGGRSPDLPTFTLTLRMSPSSPTVVSVMRPRGHWFRLVLPFSRTTSPTEMLRFGVVHFLRS